MLKTTRVTLLFTMDTRDARGSTPPPTKINIHKFISGEQGPAPMRGVQTYPYGGFQRLYHRDFSAIAAGTIQHPYMATANSAGSTPHNILTGTNFADKAYLTSDHDITFTPKDYVASRQTKGSGIRSEQIS